MQQSLVARMRTFSMLHWFGMPDALHPRRLAKMGFYCTDDRSIKCCDADNCGVSQTFGESMSFSKDPTTSERLLMQVRKAHLPSCNFKSPSYPLINMDLSAITSRKIFYLHAKEFVE